MILRIRRALLLPNLVIAFGVAVVAQQPAPQTRDDAITGRVLNESGQPLSGVSVSFGAIGGRGVGRTTTDNEGHFRVQGLDGGIYRISLTAPGYVPQRPDSAFRPGDNAELTLIKGGVIAGNVTNIAGEPVVNITVSAFQIRDGEGNRVATPSQFAQPKFTDDRGYYRVYGLPPGTYIVAAGGQGGQFFGLVNPYASDATTYAPSSTRDTAAEIVLRSNQEATADIRYRGEPGHAVSGKVSGVQPALPFNPFIRLTDVDSRMVVATMGVMSSDKTFQLNGVSDGDYEITASGGGGSAGDMVASTPRRISVKGADVTGLDLALTTMGAIDSRVNLETDPKLNCGRRRGTALRETMITLRRSRPEEKPAAKEKPTDLPETSPSTIENVANEKGEVRFFGLLPGTYRFEVRPPAAGWYLKDLSLGKPEPNIARSGVAIKQGERISGVTITIAEGGASLRGRATVGEGQTLPPNLRLYLAPAERESSDNPLRFFEGTVANDGTFTVGYIAPGRYWLVAEAAEPRGPDPVKSTRTDAGLRARILHDATALNKEITFKPCERTADYEFHYPASKP